MRIENITKDNINQLPDVELRNLKIRFIGIYDRYFADPEMKKAVDLDRQVFYSKYIVLRTEMKKRSIEFHEGVALDKEVNSRIFLKSLWGLDVPSLNEITIIKSYAAISGTFIRLPKVAKSMDVVIRNAEKNRDERLEKRIALELKAHTGKIPNFIYSPEGPGSSHIPIFDLVLKAREETKRITVTKKLIEKKKTQKAFPIEKPEESEDTIRIPVGPDCKVTATITISADEGIKALYCGLVKKIRTYLFDKKKKAWTMATARAWIKAQTEKVNKALEENLETFEYLLHHVATEGDKEIVHHCHMYDHIGNLFEQAHLYFDKGKVYLEGKEIKEGHYHVLKGLEPKQEIAWSEEAATEAGIKPKQMMSGMTLKEKAKVW